MIVRFYILILVFLAAACGSESFTEVEKNRAALLPGFESYASREEVTAKLPSEAEKKVVEAKSLTKDNETPPYSTYTISVSPFTHLDQPGKLLITFYNNRLLQTAFYPVKLDAYLNALRKSGVALQFAQELVAGNTVIWIGVDFDKKDYVGWADKRLREQQRRWLARYN